MTTNKTPIQELIFEIETRTNMRELPHDSIAYVTMMSFVSILSDYLQKEKAFAFDCFEEGQDTIILLGRQELEAAFEDFYSKYAEQHNK